MRWLPSERLQGVARAATPFARVWVPRGVVPSRKVTVPVGVPVAGVTGETVAVNVTGSPRREGFREELRATDAPWSWTTWMRVVEVAAINAGSPE